MISGALRMALAAATAVMLAGSAGCAEMGSHDDAPAGQHRTPAAPEAVPAAGGEPEDEDDTAGAQSPLDGRTIALDPGHNGGNSTDASAISSPVPDGRGGTKACNTVGTETDSGYTEHRFNWELAEELSARLEDAGATVIMSRDSDDGVGPCVDERGEFAADADALVSLHANGTEDRRASGFHVIVGAEGATAGDEEIALAREIAESLVDELETAGLERNPAYDEVVERTDLATLDNAAVPALMLEAGEMRNGEDAETLEDPEGRARIAAAITSALAAALT